MWVHAGAKLYRYRLSNCIDVLMTLWVTVTLLGHLRNQPFATYVRQATMCANHAQARLTTGQPNLDMPAISICSIAASPTAVGRSLASHEHIIAWVARQEPAHATCNIIDWIGLPLHTARASPWRSSQEVRRETSTGHPRIVRPTGGRNPAARNMALTTNVNNCRRCNQSSAAVWSLCASQSGRNRGSKPAS
jgi:hypothetical protein